MFKFVCVWQGSQRIFVERALLDPAFVDSKVFALLADKKGISTIRAVKYEGLERSMNLMEKCAAYFTMKLPASTVVIVEVCVWCAAKRTRNRFGYGFSAAGFDGFYDFPKKFFFALDKLPVILFLNFTDNRGRINGKLFVFRTFEIELFPLWRKFFDNEKKFFDFC